MLAIGGAAGASIQSTGVLEQKTETYSGSLVPAETLSHDIFFLSIKGESLNPVDGGLFGLARCAVSCLSVGCLGSVCG